ncbi:hypothetical protein [Paenibacillus sp. sgz302251]|uniref:hypothetical protein n=1 Tax=Paenibacillus sp. sgz302251 TaxID=3414493 RepID=UPI003C7DDF54
MFNNTGTILVLFILLVIIACSCGVFPRNERRVESIKEEKENVGGCGCGLGY